MREDEKYDLNRGILVFVFMVLVAVWLFAVLNGCYYEKEIQVERIKVKCIEVTEVGFGSISKARITWQDERGMRYYEFIDWPTVYSRGNISYVLLRK